MIPGPAAPPEPPVLRGARIILTLVWLVSIPLLGLIYLKLEPSPDQAQFDYMGWMATQGYPFYAGSFDMNWPGGMILHLTAVRLFGPVAWSWHMLDFLILQLSTLAAALFLRRAGFRLAPRIVLALYPALYVTSSGWMAGQRDVVAMGILVMACAAMLAPARREASALCLAGALVAFAVLVRPTYLSVMVGLLALELAPRSWIRWPRRLGRISRVTALLAGFAAVGLATLFWATATGILDDWYQQSVLFTSQVYFGDPPMDMVGNALTILLRWWHWITLCSLIGLGLWLLRDRRLGYPLMLVLGLAAAVAVSYIAQHKGFGYHLAGLLTLLTMLTSVAFDQLTERTLSGQTPSRRRLLAALTLALVALAMLGTASKLYSHRHLLADVLANGLTPVAGTYDIPAADQSRIIDILRRETGPEDRLVLYGPAYQVPYLAQRLPAYRYITPAIELITPDFPLYGAWMAEIRDGLALHRPKFILMIGVSLAQDGTVVAASADAPPLLSELVRFMGRDYKVRLRGDYGALFERQSK